jgi:hypothetical protein
MVGENPGMRRHGLSDEQEPQTSEAVVKVLEADSFSSWKSTRLDGTWLLMIADRTCLHAINTVYSLLSELKTYCSVQSHDLLHDGISMIDLHELLAWTAIKYDS